MREALGLPEVPESEIVEDQTRTGGVSGRPLGVCRTDRHRTEKEPAMTLQTTSPIERLHLQPTVRGAREISRMFSDGSGDLSPEYQRGSVWTSAQRVNLIRSFLMGLPVPSLVLSDRMDGPWPERADGFPEGGYIFAVIDGKQRIETLRDWFGGDLAVPSSWFDGDLVERTEQTDDGPYVRFDGLTRTGQRIISTRFLIPVVEAKPASLREEAELYLLLNGAGTAQTEDDMAAAARVAKI